MRISPLLFLLLSIALYAAGAQGSEQPIACRTITRSTPAKYTATPTAWTIVSGDKLIPVGTASVSYNENVSSPTRPSVSISSDDSLTHSCHPPGPVRFQRGSVPRLYSIGLPQVVRRFGCYPAERHRQMALRASAQMALWNRSRLVSTRGLASYTNHSF